MKEKESILEKTEYKGLSTEDTKGEIDSSKLY